MHSVRYGAYGYLPTYGVVNILKDTVDPLCPGVASPARHRERQKVLCTL